MKSTLPQILVLALTLLTPLAVATVAFADEGMWLLNRPPRKLLQEKYGFEATDAWLEHMQKSSVRFNSGGSGSFVSAHGLVMTNHHVGADALHKLSTAERDLVKDGFYARSHADELKCVDLELNVLLSIEDVTERINSAVQSGTDAAASQKARQAVINTIEKESLDKTGLRSDVVTLYHGGEYHLYRYKKYTDVRLVFAPEKDIAFFGGDPDNFEFPRYDLDISFFRAYENGKPAEVQQFLKWSAAGAKEDELIFVTGHPGRTNRLNTVAHLEFLRDKVFPLSLNNLRRREVLLKTYSDRSLENARQAQDELFSYQNSRKARLGGLGGLQDPAIMNRKRTAEKKLQQTVASDSRLREQVGDPWNQVGDSLKLWKEIYNEYYLLEQGMAFNTHLFQIARRLVRLADESAKPNAERLREYGEAGLESLKQELFSEAPIYPELEIAKLGDSLSFALELMGSENPALTLVMSGSSPAERAANLVTGSKLADVKIRRALYDGGKQAIESSSDPFIKLAILIDRPARAVRKTYDTKVDEPLRQSYAKVAKARFLTEGTGTYPDATFTLRLAFGEVKGYTDGGRKLPPWTTMGGTFKHAEEHGSQPPFALPPSWLKKDLKIDPETPFNFLSTADIIGGNSGSPVVNRNAELVGIIFDGNIQSLVLDFIYTQDQARATSVHSSAIVESLRNIYGAGALADELGAK